MTEQAVHVLLGFALGAALMAIGYAVATAAADDVDPKGKESDDDDPGTE